ncbi:transposase [Streptomyces bottropensis]|uniref:Transposase IS4 family protein n=1 Tax=Streptomyces bottropensis ATCC 25435 TaxID=1054862 RepID=M3E9T7_9ACTN|nr:transposase [Streptomyces bottropensis]EMF52936.1 transposase IS4 family protein [Streptomyces bottropensis ATCC 25435]
MGCRIDFTYALGLDLDDPGFHHSVLSAFRDRLAEGDRADRLLGLALTRIRRAGLLKGRVTQRTDSPQAWSRWATTPANCCNALTTGSLGWRGAGSPCRSPAGACTASPSAWGDHSAPSFGVFGNRRTWWSYRAW